MASRRRLRLGIHCVQEGSSFPEMVAFWRHVEALGYDWISLVDHLESVWFTADQPIYEVSATLAALAALTRRVRVSTLSTFEGRYYQLHEAISFPKPLQQPHPPIWVCGSGEQLMLKVVARHADGWNPTGQLSPEEYGRRADILARNCEAIHRDPAEIARSLAVMVVTAETDARANALAEKLQASIATKLVPDKNRVVGSADSCASWLRPYLQLGVTDVNARMPAGPIGPQLAENFYYLVGPRLREMAAEISKE